MTRDAGSVVCFSVTSGQHRTSRRFRVVARTNPGVVLPSGAGWSLTVGDADDSPFQVNVFAGYDEGHWSAPVPRVLYLVIDLDEADLESAIAEALGVAAGLTP